MKYRFEYRGWTAATLVFLVIAGLLGQGTHVFAQEAGQEDLDKAVELKFGAMSLNDLDEVVELIESAIKKGLEDSSKEFAQQIWASTLYDHAERLCNPIFQQRPMIAQWQFLRQQAMPRLSKSLALNDENASAHYLLARLNSLPGGDKDQAHKAIERVLELSDGDNIRMAEAYLLRGNLSTDDEEEKRLKDYAKSLELNPSYSDALRTRGLFFLLKKENDKAVADFKKLVELNEGDVKSLQSLAQALLSSDDKDAALDTLKKAIELEPDSASNYIMRAQVQLMKKDQDAAITDLTEALKVDDHNDIALLMRAQLYFENDELDKALKDIERVLVFQPGRVQAMLMRSLINAASGNFSAAVKDMEPLVRMDPDNVGWKLQLATMYYGDERPRKAVEMYTQVVEKEDENFFAHRGRADALLSFGAHAKAKEDYERCLEIRAEDSPVLNNLAWLLATSPDDKVRNGKRAIKLATKACELTDYKAAHILSTLASGYAETSDFETAIKWSKKSVELSDKEMVEDLKKELERYKAKKPWREIQESKEKKGPRQGGGGFEL